MRDHKGIRLIEDDDPELLRCPTCGTSYPIKETVTEQNVDSSLAPTNSSGTKIISGKKKAKKHYDSFANLIPEDDLDIQKDIARGYTIISYKEEKI